MIEISDKIYEELAGLLRDAIADGDYFNGAVEYETEEFYARLVATVIVYRGEATQTKTREEAAAKHTQRPISDIVPIWWELQTTQSCGPVPNDFSFSEIKPYIVING